MMLHLLWTFVPMLILSYFLTTMAQPVFTFLSKKMSASFASVVTCSLIVILIFVPIIFFVGALSSEAYLLVQTTKGTNLTVIAANYIKSNPYFLRIDELLIGYGFPLELDKLSQIISDYGTIFAKGIYSQASIWAANILTFILNFLLMIIIIFFLLLDQEKLIKFMIHLSPLPNTHDRLLIQKFDRIASAILVGNGICGVIQGVLGGLAFAILGLSSPLLWGCIMAIAAFLPIVGIGLILGPAALILIIQGQIVTGVGLAIYYLILSMSVEYLLKPKMVGSKVQMHTVLVFLSILGGIHVYGILGIIYGPLIVTGFLTLADIYIDNYERFVTNGDVD